jgi:septal ring factor EnvC (AmiA/AmiB activator)
VTEDLSNKEQLLRTQFESSEQQLSELENKLQSVSDELKSLAEKSHEFDVLGRICRSLEELEDLGATDLFWSSQDAPEVRREKIASAHRNIDEYNAEISRVEEHRNVVLEQIGGQNTELDHLHYNLIDIVEQRELRNSEWLVERDVDDIPHHNQVMPWTRGNEEDDRFR